MNIQESEKDEIVKLAKEFFIAHERYQKQMKSFIEAELLDYIRKVMNGNG